MVEPAARDADLAAAVAAQRRGDVVGAEAAYRAILAANAAHALAATNLSALLLDRGDAAAAETFARQALRVAPAMGPARATLAHSLLAQRRAGEAAAAFRAALAAGPDAPTARHLRLGLGRALRASGRATEAAPVLRNAAAVSPDAETVTEWAHALAEAGRPEEAEARYRDVLRAAPHHALALRGLGNALAWQHRLTEARDAFRAAAEAAPGWPSPLFHEAVVALMEGDYAAGWPLYEHRSAEPALAAERAIDAGKRWQGEPGISLLLRDEQGFGDTLMFARYIPLAAARAATTLQVRPELCRLLSLMPGLAVLPRAAPAPPHDAHCPLPSLPLLFNTTCATVPEPKLALALPPAHLGAWRGRIPPGRNVGLVWAGGANPPHRAIPPNALAPLLAVAGVRWWSLQKDLSPADHALLAAHPHVTSLADDLADFADTAGAMAALDLVVSVDTAAAHLAGALGVDLWVALSFLPDWRWGLAGPSPWYPGARLFRQRSFGQWGDVVADLAAALHAWAAGP